MRLRYDADGDGESLSGVAEMCRDLDLDALGQGAGGAVLGVVARAHIGENFLEAIGGRARNSLALVDDRARGRVDELEGRVELIDLTGRIAGNLHQLIGYAFLDGDVETVAGRAADPAARTGEDQLVAELLSNTARDRGDVDPLHDVGKPRASGRGAAVERLEAASGQRQG